MSIEFVLTYFVMSLYLSHKMEPRNLHFSLNSLNKLVVLYFFYISLKQLIEFKIK